MNNHYQNPQSRQQDQRYPPPYQQHPAPNPQQHQSRSSYQQGTSPITNQYSINTPIQPQTSNPNTNLQNQLFQQYANSQNPLYGKQAPESSPVYENQPIYFPPPQSQVGLLPPPQLNQQRDQQNPNEPSKNSNVMNQSNSNDENQVREILWGEQQQANTFWEQKFFLIYEKFQWFGTRFENLKTQYADLSQQLNTVDSEQDWNQLKHNHQQFAEKMDQMLQELIAVADQNQQLINQRMEEDDSVWERRYHELLSNFKALQQKTSMLQGENQDLKSSQQGQEAQQQQNYPELLSHYRNLEEEYQKLFNAYNKLQQQNDQLKANPQSKGPSLQDFESMRMQYQRTLQAIHNQNDGLKAQCQGFYQQNEHFREQLSSQAQSLAEFQHLSQQLEQKSSFMQSLNEELTVWRRKYQQLQMESNQVQTKQSQKIQQVSQEYEEQLQSLQQHLNSKQSQNSNLQKRLNNQIRSRELYIQQHHDQLQKALKSQTDKQTRLRLTVQKQLKSLHEEYESLLQKNSQTDMNIYQVDGLKKRIGFLGEENEQLIKQISGKNQQLAALRNLTLQVSTYENILEQYKSLQKDKLTLESVSMKQHNELLQTKKRLSEVEHDFTEFRNITSSMSLKSNSSSQLKQLQSQIETQSFKYSKLESQVHKFKQLVEAKERYIRELEDENSKTIIKLQYQQRLTNGTKDEHQSQVTMLQRRIQTLDKRNRSNEMDFKKQMVQNYEKEIKDLRSANQDKLKKIKRLEQTIQELSTKSSHLEKHSSIYNSQQKLFHNKLSSLEKSNTELLSKLQLSCGSIDGMQHQLTSFKEKQATLRSQLKNYTIQVEEADNLIKNKNNIIIQYEKQVQQFVIKVSALEDRIDGERMEKLQKIKKYEEEIDKLKDKLYNPPTEDRRDSLSNAYRYSSSYSNRYSTFGTKKPIVTEQRNEQIMKLESNLIEQMHEQNFKLRSQLLELTKKVHSLQSLSRVIANMEQSQSPKKSAQKSRISSSPPQRDVGLINVNVQERLLRFNQRLENCISDNELLAERDVDLTASQRIAMHERERRELEINYEKQIKELKNQVKSLEEQLTNKNSEKKELVDSDLKQFDKYEIMNQHAEKSTQEELQFLRAKLNDQQKTNASLIKLNEHLKRQLEESLQKGLHSTTEYYKLQWREAEKTFEEQKQRNKKLQDQNNRLKRQNLQHDSKIIKEYELKYFIIQEQLKELQRQNTYLKMIKAKADNQKANYQHDIHVYTADIETIKASTNAKTTHYEKITKELREKCNAMERELYEVSNSLKWGAMNGISRTVLTNQKPGNISSRRVLA